jgi:twinkle protein
MLKTWADYGIDVGSHTAGEIDTTCPQCSPTRKKKSARCLSVNVGKGTWTCHHCGWAGGIGQADRRLDVGWNKPKFRKLEVTLPPRSGLAEWFAARGIPEHVLDRNRITAVQVYMPQLEDHAKVIAFPYYRGDELVNVKYRDREKNFRMEAGAERILYGLNDIEKTCLIVEGEIDKLSLEVAGYQSCVSVPDGAPTPSTKDYASKFAFLEADEERLSAVKHWYIAVDNDEPGRRLEDELARRLGRERCLRVEWPQGCKDANDVLVQHGAGVLRQCVECAKPFPLAGVFEVEDMGAKVRALYANGWERGVSTGWDEVDRFYTVRPGEFTVVTGIPNSGKSNWLDAMLVNLARDQGWQFALFSPENQPLEDHVGRMVEKFIKAPFGDGPTNRMTEGELDSGMSFAQQHFTWILPDDDSEWTIETLLDRAKSLVFRKGIRGLVIDPWNELEHQLEKGQSETVYIGNVLRHVRQFARRYGVHVWIVAHPAKLYREKETGNYPVPTLYDISGSSHWRNKCDNGICVWRDFSDAEKAVEVHVQKVRFRQIGKIGMAKLKYEPPTATYREFGFHEYGRPR